jgi:hypothetical protein
MYTVTLSGVSAAGDMYRYLSQQNQRRRALENYRAPPGTCAAGDMYRYLSPAEPTTCDPL